MPLHTGGVKTAQAVICFFIFASWVVMLGGLGRVQDQCNGDGLTPGEPQYELAENRAGREYVRTGHLQSLGRSWNELPGKTGPDNTRDDKCGILFSYDWWIVMYQLLAFFLGVLAVNIEAMHNQKLTIIMIFTIAIIQSTIFASIYVKYSYVFNGGNSSKDEVGQGVITAASGAIAATICNYLFVFLFGLSEVSKEPEAQPQVKIES